MCSKENIYKYQKIGNIKEYWKFGFEISNFKKYEKFKKNMKISKNI